MGKVQKPTARRDKIVTQDMATETLIYDLEANKAFCLNETSTLVWQLSDGQHTVSQISDEMSKQMKNLVSEDVVWLALTQLNKDGLLENGDKLDFPFSGLSRREVIKRVGFASVITLPVVSSLVAPQAAMSQSLSPNGDACTIGNPSTCASNNCLNAGMGMGICCDAGSSQANNPGYTICTTDPTAADFDFRCCSGSASPGTGACPPSPSPTTRYVCDPY